MQAPALTVHRSRHGLVVVVPSAYRLWPDPPKHQVPIRWREPGLVVQIPGEPVITLTAAQGGTLRGWLRAAPDLHLLMMDHNGRHRLEGRLEGS